MRTFLFIAGLILLVATAIFLKNKSSLFGYRATKFSPTEIAEMVNYTSDGIEGTCRDRFVPGWRKGYKFESSVVTTNNYQYAISENKYGKSGMIAIEKVDENIITYKDFPHRIVYCITSTENYNLFCEELRKINPIALSKNNNDIFYPDDISFLVGNCVFVQAGYISDFQGNCIIAIKKDNLIPIKN